MTYGDLADRATIQILKELNNVFDGPKASDMLQELFAAGVVPDDLRALVNVNTAIWELEKDIRNMNHEHDRAVTMEDLAEIGRRALSIRTLNKTRVMVRNDINRRFGQPPETKVDHASA